MRPRHVGHPFLRSGAMPVVDDVRDWQDPQKSPWLRVVLLATDLLYRDQGARAHARMSGETLPFGVGVMADVSLAGLPGVCALIPSLPPPPVAVKIAEAINLNFPFGDGAKETATVNGAYIRLQVPTNGYPKIANVLAEWPRYGATGSERHVTPSANSLEAPVGRRIRKFS